MSLQTLKYVMDLRLITADGADDVVAKAVMIQVGWSFNDTTRTQRVRLLYEDLGRRTQYKPSAIRGALARLATGYELIRILERSRGPNAEVVCEINLEKLRDLYGAEQMELRLTSLRAVPEETPLSGETPVESNATQWRNSEKDTPFSGVTPKKIRHSVAKPGAHEGSLINPVVCGSLLLSEAAAVGNDTTTADDFSQAEIFEWLTATRREKTSDELLDLSFRLEGRLTDFDRRRILAWQKHHQPKPAPVTSEPEDPETTPVQHSEFWQRCLVMIARRVNDESFTTWFVPLDATVIGECVRIRAPDVVFAEWVTSNYGEILQAALSEDGVGALAIEWEFPQRQKGVA